MNVGSRHEQQRHAGSGRRCGECCAILLIAERPATARRSCAPGSASHDRCGNATELPAETVRTTSDHDKSGSKCRCRRWSVKKSSPWLRNSCGKTHTIRRDARRSRRCCKECWYASSLATHCIGPPREPPNKNSTTIVASARMDIVGSKGRGVRIGQCDRT